MDIDWWHPPIVDLTSYYDLRNTTVHCLDLSKVHPVLSGNKFYKLWGHLEAFKNTSKIGIVSMGGAHSNHLHALSFYSFVHEIPFIALIRQAGADINKTPTCKDLKKWGTTIIPINPGSFRELRKLENYQSHLSSQSGDDWFWIPEGGKGELGNQGLQRLFTSHVKDYSTIFINVGTGTSLLSLLHLPYAHQQKIIGIAPFKKVHEQIEEVSQAIGHKNNWEIFSDPWNLGFGKVNEEVISFVENFKKDTNMDLDYIYTSRLFYKVHAYLNSYNSILKEKVLLIHGGGLQGNRAISHINK